MTIDHFISVLFQLFKNIKLTKTNCRSDLVSLEKIEFPLFKYDLNPYETRWKKENKSIVRYFKATSQS